MVDENIERRVDYISEQQALSAARIAEIEDIIVRFARATRARFDGTDKRSDDLNEKIAALVISQRQTEESIKKTDETLRNFLATMDRYFRKGRNGTSRDK
jgi:TolA-binding protein